MTVCLVKANRQNISKYFPIVGIVLGGLTIVLSLVITIGTFYLISKIEPEAKPAMSYDLKIDNLPYKPIKEMTPEEFLTLYGILADDYENLVEVFEQDPYDIEVNDEIITLSTWRLEMLARLLDIHQELSKEEYKQILEYNQRISQATEIFNQETP
ncbi:hypothetical protein [Pseudolactococcus reticulitermitis]|uniref:Uncharacterized protein n=1 Tax=Pseudolactococcus reticulitermitis TaxID=2025039 RepID=A0A224XDT8_9LACT|nr:hypothetical protein [Lactococcus reticulitermitis]GAX48072.1 hypothetical protein RsY01_1686 [Lactococcus reticulitermitis]